jgi:hypothetical protein
MIKKLPYLPGIISSSSGMWSRKLINSYFTFNWLIVLLIF